MANNLVIILIFLITGWSFRTLRFDCFAIIASLSSSHKRVDIQLQFERARQANADLHDQPEQPAKWRSAFVLQNAGCQQVLESRTILKIG